MRTRPVQATLALLLAGALGVHQLRYLLAFGSDTSSVLAHHGHGNLVLLLPLLAAASAFGFAAGLVRAAAAPAAGSARVRAGRLWAGASAALLAIYASQELLEGMLSPGHPAGWVAVFGAGGWTAIPLVGAFGLLVALGLLAVHAARAASPSPIAAVRLYGPATSFSLAMPRDAASRRSAVLATHLAGRAPPPIAV